MTKANSGMQLAQAFFAEELYPYLQKNFPRLLTISAIGLVGPGSECLGYDDDYSKDHDFERRCCIWLPEKYLTSSKAIVNQLKVDYDAKLHPMVLEDFYEHYTGIRHWPTDDLNLLTIPENGLLTASNGQVFWDSYGLFSQYRQAIQAYYPKDIWLKRLSYHCLQAAQAGQYNYSRCLKRKNYLASFQSLALFMNHYSHLIHLINKRYQPFYKWQQASLLDCPLFGSLTVKGFNQLVQQPFDLQNHQVIEQMTQLLTNYWCREELSKSTDNFLLIQADELAQHIKDPKLRESNLWTLEV